ncbi:MAG: carbohydrate porin [Terrimicrobiaceae bacterium]
MQPFPEVRGSGLAIFYLLSALCVGGAGPLRAGPLPPEQSPAEVAAADPDPTIHTIESTNFDADFSPGESTTNTPAELDEIYAPNDGYLDAYGFNAPLDWLKRPLNSLYEKTGLRLGFANTMLFMQPLGGQSSRYGAAGDLDFMSSWTLIGRGTKDTGRFVFTGEYRFQMGDQPPSEIRGQMGAIVAPTGTFNDRGWVIRDAYWIQRLFDARVRILIGRADPSDYVGSHWLQNVNNSFVNRNFSANAAVPFPGHGPMLGVSIRPTDQFYLTVGAANAYSNTLDAEFESLFNEWDLFTFGEIGYTPTFKGLGQGRYAFGLWHIDARSIGNLPEDYGLTFIVDQNLTDRLQIFARYAYSDGTLTNIRQTGQIGLGLSGLFGRKDDLTGAAFALTIPRSDASRNETVLEAFHRFQVTRNTQLSFGLQLIANPGNAPDNETAGAFYARLRTSF